MVLLSIIYGLTQLNGLVKVKVDCSKVHCKHLNCFQNATQTFFDFVLACEFDWERFTFKGATVADSHRDVGDLFTFLIEVTVVQDRHDSKFGREHLVDSRPGSFDEEFKNGFVFAKLVDILSEHCLVKRVSSESPSHEKGS